MSKPAERNVHNADTPDFSVPDDGHGTPTSNTIGILLDACQTAKRITEALLVICVAALAGFARMQLKISHPLTGIFRRSPPWPMHLYPSNGLPPS